MTETSPAERDPNASAADDPRNTGPYVDIDETNVGEGAGADDQERPIPSDLKSTNQMERGPGDV